MSIDEYKARVVRLFQTGAATPEQWEALAACVLACNENEEQERADPINTDPTVLGPGKVECETCGSLHWKQEKCWGCGEGEA